MIVYTSRTQPAGAESSPPLLLPQQLPGFVACVYWLLPESVKHSDTMMDVNYLQTWQPIDAQSKKPVHTSRHHSTQENMDLKSDGLAPQRHKQIRARMNHWQLGPTGSGLLREATVCNARDWGVRLQEIHSLQRKTVPFFNKQKIRLSVHLKAFPKQEVEKWSQSFYYFTIIWTFNSHYRPTYFSLFHSNNVVCGWKVELLKVKSATLNVFFFLKAR